MEKEERKVARKVAGNFVAFLRAYIKCDFRRRLVAPDFYVSDDYFSGVKRSKNLLESLMLSKNLLHF